MLEIKNLSKTYRSKTGDSVRALDDISINFPESGMVFILGKSGSGKSTLLNVMGGLDSYDSGEFVIMGKSSKEFGGSDFDAYRNTFIGFIFQEYNILDDFTVGANIGLALELQGKKATDEKINEILAKVDLLSYAKRKPNELSGGQKQRVAIARALVKEPQIIMADEPTGALDSNTGKQIFDTLKELSKEKLVLIVSHDRDFAERYADRIIELSDGHIISDVTKHERESIKLSAGIEQVTSNILRIKGGYSLTAQDLMMINNYLSNNNSGDILLSSDSNINNELRSMAGVSEGGGAAVFEGTYPERDVKLKQYDKKNTKFIHSRLPIKNAVKIGSSGLKHKKFRLVMTILLSLIAFTMFGFADTLAAYNKMTAAKESIMDSNIKNASVELGVRTIRSWSDGEEFVDYTVQGMNDEDIQYLKDITGLDFVPVYTGTVGRYSGGGFALSQMMQKYEHNEVYTASMTGLVSMSAESINSAGLKVTGRLPQKTGEIAITEFMYRQFNQYGFNNSKYDEIVSANSLTMIEGDVNSIIGKHLTISGNSYNYGMDGGYDLEIVGVIDTQFDYNRYADFLPDSRSNSQDSDMMDSLILDELNDDLNYSFHALGHTTMEDILALSQMNSNSNSIDDIMVYLHGFNNSYYIAMARANSDESEKMDNYIYNFNSAVGSNALSRLDVTWLDGVERTSLADNEVVVSQNMISMILNGSEIEVSEAEIAKIIDEKYGSGTWSLTEGRGEQTVVGRIRTAAGIAQIKAVLNDTVACDEFKSNINANYADANIQTYSDAVTWWINYWYDFGNYDNPYYFNNNDKYNVSRGDIEVREDVATILNPYIAKLMGLDIDDSVAYKVPYITQRIDMLNSENMSFKMETYDYYMTLRYVEAINVIDKGTQWRNDDNFMNALKEYMGNDLNTLTSEEIKNNALGFYSDTYLCDSRYAYSKNSLGKSGAELEKEANKLYNDSFKVDIEKLNALVDWSSYIENYEYSTKSVLQDYDFKIVGYYSNINTEAIISDKIISDYNEWYSSQSEYEDYITYSETMAEHTPGIWAYAVAPLEKNASIIGKLVDMSYENEGDYRFALKNSIMYTLDSFNDFIEMGAKIFLYIGIGFAVFAALLLMNFIATSISYKKREIGVLRAVGARSSDVFKIFFSEALIIALINFVLSVVALIIAIIFVNAAMHNQGIKITLLTIGVRQIGLMLLVSVFVAAVASFLPVYNIARRKPIDAIHNK